MEETHAEDEVKAGVDQTRRARLTQRPMRDQKQSVTLETKKNLTLLLLGTERVVVHLARGMVRMVRAIPAQLG
jgi:hypothetical protein